MKFNTQYSEPITKGEYFVPGTSETEPQQAINIKQVYETCVRTQQLPPMASPNASYEIADVDSMDVNNVFDNMDYTQSNEFDMADVSTAQQILAMASKGEVADGRSDERINLKSSEERDLKSANEASTPDKE